jgi:hypothetical protein
MTSTRLLLLLPLLLIAMPANAAEPPVKDADKVTTLVVYGDDPCPRSSDEEIVVCAREPESERYRIPKRLRRAKPDAAERSWGDRVQVLEMVGRQGTPNSCSPIGSNGQTGCMAQFMRQAREERRKAETEGSQIP